MDTRLLDVLHHPADDRLWLRVGNSQLIGSRIRFRREVRYHIDIHLDCFRQEAVDEHRGIGKFRYVHRRSHVPSQGFLVEADLHASTTKYVTGSNKHGIPDVRRDHLGFLK